MILGAKPNSAILDNCWFIKCGDPGIFLGYTNDEWTGEADSRETFQFTTMFNHTMVKSF